MCISVMQMKFHTQQTNGVRTLSSSTMATTTTTTTTITSPPLKQEHPQTEWEEMLCATPKTTFQQRDDKGMQYAHTFSPLLILTLCRTRCHRGKRPGYNIHPIATTTTTA